MSNSRSLSFANPWIKRLVWAAASVLLLWLISWLAVPVLLKWQLQKQASQALGRNVTVQRVDFRPWSRPGRCRAVVGGAGACER